MTTQETRTAIIVAHDCWPCVQNLNVLSTLENSLGCTVDFVYVAHKEVLVDHLVAVISFCLETFA